jgi:hypothetical protein
MTAPIVVTIPKEKVEAFKQQLREIAGTIHFINEQFVKMDKLVKKVTRDSSKGIKLIHQDNRKVITDNRTMINQGKKKVKSTKRLSRAWGGVADGIAKVRVGLGLAEFALQKIVNLMILPAAMGTGFIFAGERINKMTTEMSLLAKASGFALNDLRGLGLEAKTLGFTFEHVSSLVEELNNKMGGEEGGFIENNLREGLKAINLEAEALQKLSPDKQFAQIMNAARTMGKEAKNLPIVASALDKIFGQEANRMLTGFVQKMNKGNMSYEEFLRNSQKYGKISKQAEEGAIKFTEAINGTLFSIATLSREFFGLFGNTFADTLDTASIMIGAVGTDFKDLGKFIMATMNLAFSEILWYFSKLKTWLKKNEGFISTSFEDAVKVSGDLFKSGMNIIKALTFMLPLLGKVILAATTLLVLFTEFAASDFGQVLLGFLGVAFALNKVSLLVMALPALLGTAAGAMTALWAANPFGLMAIAIGAVVLAVAQLTGEMDTLMSLFTSKGWKDIAIGMGITDPEVDKTNKLKNDDPEVIEARKNSLLRMESKKKQQIISGGNTTSTQNSVSTDKSLTTSTINNTITIDTPVAAEVFVSEFMGVHPGL